MTVPVTGKVLRVGVVGAGMMGSAHVRMLGDLSGVQVTGVCDADGQRAGAVAGPVGATAVTDPEELLASVDAVVVASPDSTHADLVTRSIALALPVMCEKPLALTVEESQRVVDAEVASGRRLVQVGFMRRYDPGLLAVRGLIRDGELGEVRVVHCVHRNARSATSTSDANLVTGSMIHELDQMRWLLGDEIAAIQIVSPVRHGFKDPQLATIAMRSGALVTVEVFVNASYGYDVRCEVVGTAGTATAADVPPVLLRRQGLESHPVPADFVVRYADAYRAELADWTRAARDGTASGASAWDGHLANVAAAAGIEALASGGRVHVPRPAVPALYA